MVRPQRLTVSSGVRTAAILIGVIFVLYEAREIFIPLAFAITLALILSPAVGLLQKLRIGRAPAVALVMLLTMAALMLQRERIVLALIQEAPLGQPATSGG